jgi:glyceraldehyde-3-phosphate dehydrogenase/erythrose-4-phosphate dehydrogenase
MRKAPRSRLGRAIARALLKRDRLEIQAIDALLSAAAPRKRQAMRRRRR